ncbi:hypothetical protein BDZ97DRAFT_1918988 [Flammula alnicola]|nr:hypothetical protein BDZ97DRAFT_1918988 [Flammula alnicola]
MARASPRIYRNPGARTPYLNFHSWTRSHATPPAPSPAHTAKHRPAFAQRAQPLHQPPPTVKRFLSPHGRLRSLGHITKHSLRRGVAPSADVVSTLFLLSIYVLVVVITRSAIFGWTFVELDTGVGVDGWQTIRKTDERLTNGDSHADLKFAACKDDETSADTREGNVAVGAMGYVSSLFILSGYFALY